MTVVKMEKIFLEVGYEKKEDLYEVKGLYTNELLSSFKEVYFEKVIQDRFILQFILDEDEIGYRVYVKDGERLLPYKERLEAYPNVETSRALRETLSCIEKNIQLK